MSGAITLRNCGWHILTCALAAGLVLPAPSRATETSLRAVFIDRPAADGYLIDIDAEWNLKFQIADKLTVVPASDLVYWGAYRDREAGPQVVLADGGILRADVLELTSETVTIGDATGLGRCLWDESALPRSAVRGILLQPPADALARDKLIEQLQDFREIHDQLLLTSGEFITGRLEETPKGGRFLPENEPAADVYKLSRVGAAELLTVPAGKVVAVLFGRPTVPPAERPAGEVQLGFRDGSLVAARQVATKGDTVEIALSGGGTLAAPVDQPDEAAPTLWRQITWVQPTSDRVIYLSSLKPIGYKHIPLLTLEWPHGTDRNVIGGRLRNADGVYGKGLGMHSVSRLAYELDGKFRRFEAELTLDEAAGLRGSVIFKVLVERQPNQWSAAYESPIIRGGDKPLPVSIDIKNARRLALIVDYADRADEQDHANWLMARLIR